jgi:hypothetical protein
LIDTFLLHHRLMRVLYLDYENYSTKKLIVEDIDLFFRLSIYFDLGIHGVFEVEAFLVTRDTIQILA